MQLQSREAVLEKKTAELQLNIFQTELDVSKSKFIEQGAIPKSFKVSVDNSSSPHLKNPIVMKDHAKAEDSSAPVCL